MNNLPIYKKVVFFLTFLSLTATALAQDSNAWTEKSAAKWLHSKEWKNGLKLNVHPSVNKVVFAVQYHKNQAVWDKVFAFLRDSDLMTLKPGKYIIDGDNA